MQVLGGGGGRYGYGPLLMIHVMVMVNDDGEEKVKCLRQFCLHPSLQTQTQKKIPNLICRDVRVQILNLISDFLALPKIPFSDFQCIETQIFSGISDYFRLFSHS